MKKLPLLLISALAASTAFAGPGSLGTNITVYDNSSTGNNWEGAPEDNETEPGTVHTQIWDLEGFFLNATKKLSIVGGYNFKDGVTVSGNPNSPFTTGDIFIDTTGNATYGAGAPGGLNGFDWAIKITSFGSAVGGVYTGNYSVYKTSLGGTAVAPTDIVNGSSPWMFTPTSTAITTGTFKFGDLDTSNTVANGFGFQDGSGNVTTTAGVHYYLSGFDLSFLTTAEYNAATFHYTMECGNDNLVGRTPGVPDAGSTALLLLTGLAALIGVRKRFVA